MKHLQILAIALLFVFNVNAQEKNKNNSETTVTTYYFIRHAEKDRTDKTDRDPHLIDIGLERAEQWNAILANIKFDAVYSTNYNRTKETAQPTATKNNLEITLYDPRGIDNAEGFLNDTKGKTVLVVGHSNTTPAFVNAVIKQKKYQDIDDNNNGNIYIVTIIDGKISDTVLTIN